MEMNSIWNWGGEIGWVNLKFKMLIGRIKQASAYVERNLKEQKALTDKTKAIKEAIESDSLDSMLEEKRRETELKATDAQKEAQRKDSIKASIQKIRARTGNHAQGVADKVQKNSVISLDSRMLFWLFASLSTE